MKRKALRFIVFPALVPAYLLCCTPAPKVSGEVSAPPADTVEVPDLLSADEKDSLESAASIFNKELKKADFKNIPVHFNRQGENGLSVFLRPAAEKQGVAFPSTLKKFNPEGFYILATGNRITIIGNSALAVRHAVYQYLEQLGFRYYQPGEEWEIVPAIYSPYRNFETLTQPAYEFRHFANGHGFNKNKNLQQKYDDWARANYLGGSFPVTIGHVYQNIVSGNKEEFRAHPEYFAGNVKAGELPPTAKFNVANRNLVELVKRDASARVKEAMRINKGRVNMISMEPSDGGGFCITPACLAIGGPSDQVFYLANEVAKHIRKEYPGVWVGSLAYNEHILPVKQNLEPNVFVMVTNGFNRSKYTTSELIKMWSAKASKTGVYEYLDVYEWANDLPGRANASQLSFLKKSINDYYANGARAYLAETNMGWVSKGLGQYIAARLLWNPAVNIDSIANDYFTHAFGAASNDIKKLYASWETAPKGFLSDNLLADWIQWIQDAEKKTRDKEILTRVSHLKIYLHYLVLYKQLKTKPSVQAMNDVLVFANRTFETGAFATFPTMVSLPKYSGYESMGFYNPSDQAWKKNDKPLTTAEIDALFLADARNIRRIDGLKSFTEVQDFETGKEPAIIPAMKVNNPVSSFVGTTRFTLKVVGKSKENLIELKSGWSARPEQDKPVTVKVYRYDLFQQIRQEADVVLSDTQWSKATVKKISLATLDPGEYVVEVEDQLKIFNIRFAGNIRYNVLMSPDRSIETSSVAGLNNFYFIVTPGVKKFILHKSKTLKLRSPAGRVLEYTDNKSDSYTIEVRAGEEGIWQVFGQVGNLFIEGVPPYLGVKAEKFLLPAGSF